MKFTIPAMCFALIRLSQTINTRIANPSAEVGMHMFASGPATQEVASEDEEGEVELPANAKVTQKKIFKMITELLNMI